MIICDFLLFFKEYNCIRFHLTYISLLVSHVVLSYQFISPFNLISLARRMTRAFLYMCTASFLERLFRFVFFVERREIIDAESSVWKVWKDMWQRGSSENPYEVLSTSRRVWFDVEIYYKASAEETSYRTETKILQRTQAIQTNWISPPAYCANQAIFHFTKPKQHRQPRPPRLPRSKPVSSLSQFVAPSAITDPKLYKKSPEFRLAHVRYYNKLKEKFPFLDKTMYHEANKEALGVAVRRFRQFFDQAAVDKIKIEKPPEPKPVVAKKQESQRRHCIRVLSLYQTRGVLRPLLRPHKAHHQSDGSNGISLQTYLLENDLSTALNKPTILFNMYIM